MGREGRRASRQWKKRKKQGEGTKPHKTHSGSPELRIVATGHSLERYREHHPEASTAQLVNAAREGTLFPQEKAHFIAHMAGIQLKDAKKDDIYKLAPEMQGRRKGVFVLRESERRSGESTERIQSVVTYFRWDPQQQEIARRVFEPERKESERRRESGALHSTHPLFSCRLLDIRIRKNLEDRFGSIKNAQLAIEKVRKAYLRGLIADSEVEVECFQGGIYADLVLSTL